jgi:hypothetical protein
MSTAPLRQEFADLIRRRTGDYPEGPLYWCYLSIEIA